MTATGGTGVGGNIGGPQIPLQRDLEATAWTEINKASLGIAMDTIEQVLTEISPRFQFGYLGGFGYKSSPDQPLLDHPLESTRVLQSFTPQAGNTWMSVYENLFQQLPADVQQALLVQDALPLDQRMLPLVALENALYLMAQFLANLGVAAQPEAVGSIEEQRTLTAWLLPFTALQAALGYAGDINNYGFSYIRDLGPNAPNFDGLLDALNQLQTALVSVQAFRNTIGNTLNEQLNSTTSALAALASQQLSALNSQLDRVNFGNDLQILSSIVQTLNAIVSAFTLPFIGSASLFMSLNTAMSGIYANESQTGLIGPNLQSLIDSLSTGFLTYAMPNASGVSGGFFNQLLTLGLLSFIIFASQTAENGSGTYPATNAYDLQSAKFLTFELLLGLASSSNMLSCFFNEAIAISGGNERAQIEGGTALAAFSMLLIILSGIQYGNQPATTSLTAHQSPSLLNGLLAAGQIVESWEEGITGNETSLATVAFSQMQIALEDQNYGEFVNICTELLQQMGIPQADLEQDIRSIQQIVSALTQNFQQHGSDSPLTGIVNVV